MSTSGGPPDTFEDAPVLAFPEPRGSLFPPPGLSYDSASDDGPSSQRTVIASGPSGPSGPSSSSIPPAESPSLRVFRSRETPVASGNLASGPEALLRTGQKAAYEASRARAEQELQAVNAAVLADEEVSEGPE